MVTPGSLLKFMTICYSILVNFNEKKKRVEHRFGRKKVEIYLVQKLESGQWLLLLKITGWAKCCLMSNMQSWLVWLFLALGCQSQSCVIAIHNHLNTFV